MTRRMANFFLLPLLAVVLLHAHWQSPQNTGSPDLTGRWLTEDHRQFNIEKSGQHVRATLIPGSDKCSNGASLDYLFDGSLSGADLKGKMNACTDEKLVNDCGLAKVWTTDFTAIVARDEISGSAFIEGRNAKCLLDPQYDTYETFTLKACENLAVTADNPIITPDASTNVQIRVTCGQIPVKDATVEIILKVQDQSGSHIHSKDRPRGLIDDKKVTDDSPITRKTDADGRVTVKFDPPYKVPLCKNVGIAGIYELTVRSQRLPNRKIIEPISVEFSNLHFLLEAPNPYYEIVRGHTDTHPDGTWGTAGTLDAFRRLAEDFYNVQQAHNQQLQNCHKPIWGRKVTTVVGNDVVPVPVSVNDIALPDGGLFDWKATWKDPHQTHGKGEGGDFNRFGEISDDQTKKECDGTDVAYRSWLIHVLLELGRSYGHWDCSDLGMSGDQSVGPTGTSSYEQCKAGEFPPLDWIPPNLHLHVED